MSVFEKMPSAPATMTVLPRVLENGLKHLENMPMLLETDFLSLATEKGGVTDLRIHQVQGGWVLTFKGVGSDLMHTIATSRGGSKVWRSIDTLLRLLKSAGARDVFVHME